MIVYQGSELRNSVYFLAVNFLKAASASAFSTALRVLKSSAAFSAATRRAFSAASSLAANAFSAALAFSSGEMAKAALAVSEAPGGRRDEG